MWHGCSTCDVVTINCPLHEGTRGMFNKELIGKMKPGSYLVRTPSGLGTPAVVHAAGPCGCGGKE